MIDNDRDYAAERIDDPIQQPITIVPCATCRCPVQVMARSNSIFDKTYCLRCTRSQYAVSREDPASMKCYWLIDLVCAGAVLTVALVVHAEMPRIAMSYLFISGYLVGRAVSEATQ